MNSDLLFAVVTVATGLLAGAVYFGGLWLTVRRGMASPSPALLFLGSYLLRTAVVVVLFVLAADGRAAGFVLCGAGFIAARIAATRILGPNRMAIGGAHGA